MGKALTIDDVETLKEGDSVRPTKKALDVLSGILEDHEYKVISINVTKYRGTRRAEVYINRDGNPWPVDYSWLELP